MTLDEYVDYGFEEVVIPSDRIATCHEAMQAWAGRSYATLEEALLAFSHEFHATNGYDLELTWIKLETRSPTIEPLYKLLAPFVRSGAKVYCSDEQGQHLCYLFEHSRVYRIEGRVVYDGEPIEV